MFLIILIVTLLKPLWGKTLQMVFKNSSKFCLCKTQLLYSVSGICPAHSHCSLHLNEVTLTKNCSYSWQKASHLIACSEPCLQNQNFKLASFEDERKKNLLHLKEVNMSQWGTQWFPMFRQQHWVKQVHSKPALKEDDLYWVKGNTV